MTEKIKFSKSTFLLVTKYLLLDSAVEHLGQIVHRLSAIILVQVHYLMNLNNLLFVVNSGKIAPSQIIKSFAPGRCERKSSKN